MSGSYITPFASSLIKKENVSGIMLDTTWKLLQKYIVSIQTLIVCNIGVPIGFTFSIVEDTFIYKDFFDTFQNSYRFKIKDYIKVIESDQGKPLRSFVKGEGFQHLICLRHLLSSLRKSQFSYKIGYLVSAVNQDDLEELKKTYSQSWKQIKDQKELDKLKRLLKKLGFIFDDEKIKISDEKRWTEIAMTKRAEFRKPSWTN